MKFKLIAFGLLSSVLFLTGCVEQNTHVNIHADGSADISQTILLSEELSLTAQSQGESVTADMVEDLGKEYPEGEGFKVKAIEEGEKHGVQVSKHYENVEDVFKSEFLAPESEDEEIKNPWNVKVDEKFFATYFKIDSEVKYEDWLIAGTGMTDTEMDMMKQVSDSFDFTYSMTTPVKAVSDNADTSDGRTYTWNLELEGSKSIELEYHVLNMKNVAIVGGVGTVALFSLLFFLIRARKQKRQN